VGILGFSNSKELHLTGEMQQQPLSSPALEQVFGKSQRNIEATTIALQAI
jgi:hypothetical protein